MNARRGVLGAAAAALLIGASFGCGGSGLPDKVKYAAPPQAMLQGGVSVTFKLTHADEEDMKVRVIVTNMSNQVMMVNRDGFALRLPDGRILQRRGSMHEPYILQPGAMHDVNVDFHENGLDMRTVQTASVIVGGISYTSDPMPRDVGELPLSQAGSVD
jgi:hypothetical protein